MNPYHLVGLILFVVAVAALLIRYVDVLVDREFRNLARAVSDGEYRAEELARTGKILADTLPLPGDVDPLPPPAAGFSRLVAPTLLTLGIVMLWGGVFAAKDADLWLYGGAAATLTAIAVMLLTLRRRKWERVARLLRFRADLRRIDGDFSGSAADLEELLKLSPWDDAAWAELSDDLASRGDLDKALDAVRQASRLDPRYDEYRMVEASLAIRLNRLDTAREAIAAWIDEAGVAEDDPRLVIYRAAIDLAEGKREEAALAVRRAALDEDGRGYEFLDTDQALRGVRDLLPGRE